VLGVFGREAEIAVMVREVSANKMGQLVLSECVG